MSLVYLPTRFTTDFFNLSCGSRLKYDTTKYLPLFGSVYVILHGILDNNLSLSLSFSPTKPEEQKFFFQWGLRRKTRKNETWDRVTIHTHAHKRFHIKILLSWLFLFGEFKSLIHQFRNNISHVNRACAKFSLLTTTRFTTRLFVGRSCLIYIGLL